MSQTTVAQVLEALRPIIDPDLGKSIVDLGFVKNVVIDGSGVSFTIELTTPACPVKAEFEREARERVLALEGIESAEVQMSASTRGRPAAASEEAVLPGVKNAIAVASGKGGVGKSTVAVNLAVALRATGASVGLMDADVYGPSLPLLLGVRDHPQGEKKDGKEWIVPLEAHGLRLMSIGFLLTEDSPVIWRGPMVHGMIGQFLSDVDWGDLDYLVIDLPPGTGDAALTLTQQAPLAGAVVVTTANDLSLIDARKGLRMFEKVNVPVLGIAENMSYFVPPDLPDRKYYIFGQGGGKRTADELGVDFLGEIPIDPQVVEGGDTGKPERSRASSPSSRAARPPSPTQTSPGRTRLDSRAKSERADCANSEGPGAGALLAPAPRPRDLGVALAGAGHHDPRLLGLHRVCRPSVLSLGAVQQLPEERWGGPDLLLRSPTKVVVVGQMLESHGGIGLEEVV
jgi:ATP-binding protein involved in chromosome partitioning